MQFTLFNKTFFAILLLFLAPVVTLSLYMDPNSNELTRMGGYLENRYGWNSPQEHFNEPLFTKAKSIDEYNKYYDVVVLGDSFSDNVSNGWQNYLANETGFSIISFSMHQVTEEEITSSSVYLTKPPLFYIYETVERNVPKRHAVCHSVQEDMISTQSVNDFFVMFNPLNVPVAFKNRQTKYSSIFDYNFSSAINFLKKNLLRQLFDLNTTEVHNFSLSRGNLFSSREHNSLLVINRDFKLVGVTKNQVDAAKCNLLQMQNRIIKSGTTRFILLTFPDKTSVYAEFIEDEKYNNLSIVKRIEDTPGLNAVRLIDRYKKSVREGIKDLYLPNDTHCSFYGYKIAAKSVIELMK